MRLFGWLRARGQGAAQRPRPSRIPLRRHRLPLRLEALEDRIVPSAPQQSPDPAALGPHSVQRLVYQQTSNSDTTFTGPFTIVTVPNPSGNYPDPEHPSNPANTSGPLPANFYGDFVNDNVFKTELPLRVEVLADVYAPTDLNNGPYPILFFLHGQHSTIYNPTTGQFGTPGSGAVGLPAGFDPIPNYIGYDYIGQELASHGYIVVSISANGINDQSNASPAGMLARGELVQQHIRIWDQINHNGAGALAPAFNAFQGEVNLQSIGLMGHSRGGEGVVDAYNYNLSLHTPYVIKAVLPLAPVDFHNPLIANVPLGVILPYSDGDVSDLEGLGYFDKAFANNSTSPEEVFLVMGADHDFFNTVWTPFDPRETGANVYNPTDAANHPFHPTDATFNNPFPDQGVDDWNGEGSPAQQAVKQSDSYAGYFQPQNQRLSAAQERAVGLAYFSGFFRRYVGDETAFQPMLDGDASPPASALGADIHVTYLAGSGRLDINRLDTNTTTNNLGGAVVTSGANVQTTFLSSSNSLITTDPAEHEPDVVNFSGYPILDRYQISWNQSSAYYENDLPNTDLSTFAALELRAGVVPDTQLGLNDSPIGTNSFGQSQNFSVVLRDGEGHTASVKVGDWSTALYYPPGGRNASNAPINDPLPKVMLNAVRIPLNAFLSAAPTFDLTDVVAVRFAFNQTSSGDLELSDISLDDSAGPVRAIVDPTDASKTALYITGTSGGDSVVLKQGAAAGQVQVTLNSVGYGTFSPTGHVYVYAGAGADTTTLNFSSGNFLSPTLGVVVDGGPGSNTLDLQGNSTFVNEVETPTSATAGTIVFDSNPAISYVDTSTVDDTTTISGTATFKGTSAGESINVTNGSTLDGVQTTKLDSGASATFATVFFADKPTAVVDGVGGADTVTDNNPNPAAGLNKLKVLTGPTAGATVNFQALAVTTDYVGAAAATVGVGLNHSVQGILATLNLESPTNKNTITLDDGADSTARTVVVSYFINSADSESNNDLWGKVHGLSAFADVNYEQPDTTSTTLEGGSGNNRLQVIGTAGSTTNWTISGANSGKVSGGILFSGMKNLEGGANEDVFAFGAAGGVSGTVDGGGGIDWLDYRAKLVPVAVNLTAHTASYTAGAFNIRNVLGSAAGSNSLVGSGLGGVLVGFGTGNTLVSGGGSNILVGGFGKSLILGGAGNNLEVGGRTAYDNSTADLDALYAEWSRPLPVTYAQRVADLRTGAGLAAGRHLVLNQTVFVPSIPGGLGPHFGYGGGGRGSILVGGAPGLNWFFVTYAQEIVGWKRGLEAIN